MLFLCLNVCVSVCASHLSFYSFIFSVSFCLILTSYKYSAFFIKIVKHVKLSNILHGVHQGGHGVGHSFFLIFTYDSEVRPSMDYPFLKELQFLCIKKLRIFYRSKNIKQLEVMSWAALAEASYLAKNCLHYLQQKDNINSIK